jgi:cytochrome c oxidase subunit 2
MNDRHLNQNPGRSGERRRVLIASANPLFGKGLQKIYSERWGVEAVEFSLTRSMEETLARMESWKPHLVIVDHDDQTIHREEFLSHFITGDRPMQVMLVSLQASGAVVVYDRRSLSPAQAEDWLNLPWQPVSTTSEKRRSFMRGNARHFITAGILVIISTVLVDLLLQNVGLLPKEASVQSTFIDQLFSAHFFMIALLFSIIVVFMLYSLVVFRGKPGDKQSGAYIKGNSTLEVVWTVIPLGTVIAFSFYGSQILNDIRRADPQAMNVKVTAAQWSWVFEYPDNGGIKSKDLVLPVNKQVLFSLTSLDVIHSFFVPEFRLKQDVLPGANLVKTVRITPNRIGKYEVMCAELCGGAHAYMTAAVNVVSKADFDSWVKQQASQVQADPAARGKQAATVNGCLACHSVDGNRLVGPTWKGLAGSQVTLADGTTIPADDAYIITSIKEPNAQVVSGYPPNVMPSTYATSLSDDEINDIVAFIKSLK